MNVFTVTLPLLPDPIFMQEEAKFFSEILNRQHGLIGVSPYIDATRAATFAIFDSLDHARAAAMQMSEHYSVGDYIMKATMSDDMQGLMIEEPAERWKGGPVQ